MQRQHDARHTRALFKQLHAREYLFLKMTLMGGYEDCSSGLSLATGERVGSQRTQETGGLYQCGLSDVFLSLLIQFVDVSSLAFNEVRTRRTSVKGCSCFSVALFRRVISMARQEQQRFANRLAQEKSSYLQQHAHNPVNW